MNDTLEDSVRNPSDLADLKAYGRKLMKYAAIAFAVVSGVLIFSIIFSILLTSHGNESLDFIRINKSIQITMCMICGLLFAFFGVALSWAGIRGTLDGSIKSEGMSATFNTASPGIVMMICGAVLIGIATTREVNTKRTTVKPIESAETQDVKIYTEETTEEEE